ncbi:hypothetical protein VTO73DRAFT_7340 [Trametes versicolor]
MLANALRLTSDCERHSAHAEANAWPLRPQDLTADTVFKGDTPDELRRDIICLTVAAQWLREAQRGDKFRDGRRATSARAASVSTLDKTTLSFLGHIATLLTTGSPEEEDGTAIAVTGHLEPDGRCSLVCARSERVSSTAAGATSALPKLEKIPVDSRAAQNLTDDREWAPATSVEKPFDEHLRDVVAIVAYVLGMSRQERQSEHLALLRLDLFFIRRAHRKLAARVDIMDRGTRWPGRPLVLMRECYATSPLRFNTTVRLSCKLALLGKHGILPSDPASDRAVPHIYPLTNLNVGQWLTLLEDLLLRLKGALFGGHGKLHEIREVPTVDATKEIYVCLHTLDTILRSDLFKILDGHGMDACLRSRFDQVQRSDESGEIPEDVDEAAALWSSDGNEGAVMQLHRYLQTITAWITARQRLVAFKGTIKTLDIFYLKNTPHLTITHEDVKTFVDTYVQRLELAFDNYPAEYLAKAKAVLTERKLLSKNGNTSEEFAQLCQGQMTMHPETSLMALASAAMQESEDNPLKSQIPDGVFPRQGNIAIGTRARVQSHSSCQELMRRSFPGFLPLLVYHSPS